ncbi:MAG: hypothetical protein PSX36_01665 [bacterium]|nr:hypothetical protein [bacterium]
MKSLKKIAFAVIALLLFQHANAQKKAQWKELSDFHNVMSKTFHPAEEGNLQPLKDNSADLLAKARIWQISVYPAGYKVDETKIVLAELTSKCDEVNRAVIAKKSDAELKKLITEAHDVFHQVAEKCRQPEGTK